MRGNPLAFIIITAILLAVDFYAYQAVRAVTRDAPDLTRRVSTYVYWGMTIVAWVLIASMFVYSPLRWHKPIFMYSLGYLLIIYLSKLFIVVFLFLDEILRIFRWIFQLIFPSKTSVISGTVPAVDSEPAMFPWRISRLKFISQVGMGVAALFFATGVYGILVSAYNYRVRRVRVGLRNLPESFNGLKIVQISDIHSGSFTRTSPLIHAVETINKENADVIFFTGDLVNDRASEVEPYLEIFGKLKAKHGVFSTYGNHDYGDYDPEFRRDPKAKAANMKDMASHHKTMGWDLLMDEHRFLQRGEDKIAIIGIQNCAGGGHFHTYGDLEKAYRGTESAPVKLLLSHDPSYWDACINQTYPDIDITFSGHTHGAQFGIEIPGHRWSPSQYLYKEWAGLYRHPETKQYIYTNRGFGFLGYPGRIGILPEITVFELFRGEGTEGEPLQS